MPRDDARETADSPASPHEAPGPEDEGASAAAAGSQHHAHDDLPPPAPSPAARVALLIIRGYKAGISPLMPPACRFVPTCSEYGYEAIAKYGIIRGGRLALWRLFRCNPFGGSGYDPVP